MTIPRRTMRPRRSSGRRTRALTLAMLASIVPYPRGPAIIQRRRRWSIAHRCKLNPSSMRRRSTIARATYPSLVLALTSNPPGSPLRQLCQKSPFSSTPAPSKHGLKSDWRRQRRRRKTFPGASPVKDKIGLSLTANLTRQRTRESLTWRMTWSPIYRKRKWWLTRRSWYLGWLASIHLNPSRWRIFYCRRQHPTLRLSLRTCSRQKL